MGNQPVYRYPPRSHAYNCPCSRCVQCRRNRSLGSSGAWIWPLFLVLGAVSWAVGAAARHPLVVAAAGAGIAVLALVAWAVAVLNRRERVRPPKGRLRAEATAPGPPPPARPACLHPQAVRMAGAAWPQETLDNWCPACDTRLGAGFRWSCCSAPPGNSPGAGHLYNCPNRKDQP